MRWNAVSHNFCSVLQDVMKFGMHALSIDVINVAIHIIPIFLPEAMEF